MKAKNISFGLVLFCAALNLLVFQNCSKVAVSELSEDSQNKIENVAIAMDDEGHLLPVEVDDAKEVIPSGDVVDQPLPPKPEMPSPMPEPIVDQEDDKQPPVADKDPENDVAVEPPAEDMVSACGLNLQTIHRVVDLAQFKDQDVNLELLQGKTLIYSSNPDVSLKSLSIDVGVGRTILCGCKVDKLNVKKGRLEVFRSEIKEIGDLRGKLITDSESKLPAGF